MTEQMAIIFVKYMQLSTENNINDDIEEFTTQMDDIEKDFKRSNEFVSVSLRILGKKANLPWCKFLFLIIHPFLTSASFLLVESLASSLSTN